VFFRVEFNGRFFLGRAGVWGALAYLAAGEAADWDDHFFPVGLRLVCMGELVVCKRCSERRLWSWKPGLMFFLDCVDGFAQGGFRLGCYPLLLRM
jgi:hypothetical protein